MFEAIVADDEVLARRAVERSLSESSWIRCVGEASDGLSALTLIDQLQPHLAFLDVRMPGLSGLEVIGRSAHAPAVVFITAYDDYAHTAFDLEAVDYLVKPFAPDRFQRTLDRVRRALLDAPVTKKPAASPYLRRLFVPHREGQFIQLALEDVSHFEASGNYVTACAHGNRYLLHETLTSLAKKLDPHCFRRVHRSAIVNLDHVKSIAKLGSRDITLMLREGHEIRASRAGAAMLRDLIG